MAVPRHRRLRRSVKRAAGRIAQQAQPFTWAPVLLALGIAVYFALPAEPAQAAPVLLTLAVTVLAAAAWRTGRAGFRIVCLAAAMVLTGVLAGTLRTQGVGTPVLDRGIGSAEVTGRVLAVSGKGDGGRDMTVVLQVDRIGGLGPGTTPRRLRLAVPARGAGPDLLPGVRVEATARLWPPPPPVAPGAYDFGRRLFFESIGGLGQVRRLSVIAPVDGAGGGGFWASLRAAVAERLRVAIPGSAGGVAVALVTGDRGGIPPENTEHLRAAGLAHLLAISGLHMGLVVGAVFGAVRGTIALIPPLALRLPAKKIAAVAAMVAATAYLGISGASVPTVRAFLMAMLVLSAVLIDRRAISMRTVALAALVILALQPEALLEAGFQMSFAAVVALVAIYERWSARPRGERPRQHGALHRVAAYMAGVAGTSLIAGLATAPFAAYHFDRVAVLGLLANLAAVPVVALLVMPALVAGLLLELGWSAASEFALAAAGWGIDAVLAVAAAVAALPGAEFIVARPPLWALIAVVAGSLVLLLQRGGTRWMGLVPLCAGLAAFATARGPDILVDDIGATIAVRLHEEGDYAIALNRRSTFAAERWLRADGDPRPLEVARTAWEAACGTAVPCVLSGRGGIGIAVLTAASGRSVRGEEAHCALAAIIIAPREGLRCPELPGHAIDRTWLEREGATALTVQGERVHVETVARARGNRPWVPQSSQ